MAGRPKKLTKLERRANSKKSELVVDELTLDSVLNKVGTSRIAVVSAAGSARSGKSYLLNFIHRYFSWEKDDDEDWIGWDAPNSALDGFNWGYGDDAVTWGIWIWSEPLMAKTSSGEVIAVLLIDTQGTLNEFTTEDESITITSLCLLLSSITIYNVNNDIEQDNLQLLKKSLLTCQELLKENCNFHDLLFAVRDWKRGGEVGADTSRIYLGGKLEVKSSQTEEAKTCRELIKKNFKNLSCILFPDPGDKVKVISHKGHLTELDIRFTEALEKIPHFFDPDILHNKLVGLNSVAFKRRFHVCIKLLNEHELVNPEYQQRSNNSHLQAFEMYRDVIETHPKEFFSAEDFRIVHERARQKALNYLDNENGEISYRVMRHIQFQFSTMVSDYYEKVSVEYDKKGRELQEAITSTIGGVTDTYIDSMKTVFDGDVTTEKRIEQKHKLFKKEALTDFRGLIPDKYQHLDFAPQLQTLEKIINENFAEMKRQWASRKKENLLSDWNLNLPFAIEDYKKRMTDLSRSQSFLSQTTLQENHENVMQYVVNKYCNSMEYASLSDEFQTTLRNELKQIYLEIDKQNNEKRIRVIEGKLEKALVTALTIHRQSLIVIEEDERLTLENFVRRNDEAKAKIRRDFLDEIEPEPQDIRTEYSNRLNLDLETQSKEAINRFNAATQRRVNIIGGVKNEIKEESDNLFDSYWRSNEILDDGKIEEIRKNLITHGMMRFDTLKNDGTLSSEMLDRALNETIQLINTKAKNVVEKGQVKFYEYNQKVPHLVEKCFESYTKTMEKFENIDSEELLEKRHNDSLKSCIQELKNQCLINDEKLLRPHINNLVEMVTSHYRVDIKRVFMFELERDNVQLNSAKDEATKLYREEMNSYFSTTPYTTPANLLGHHSKLCARITNNLAQKLRLKNRAKAKLTHFLDKDFETYENQNRMNTPTNEPAIGIDLGTTYTCVAIYENGKARVIPNEMGSFTFPSYVAFTDRGELVGHAAKEMAHLYPQNTIFDAKRLIGRRFNEATVQSDIKNWPFEVVDEGNVPKIKVQTNDGEKIIPPEKISAKILNHVKSIAEQHLGKKIKKAVITVPAYFNDGQRQATKDAGEIAGLEVLQIINEPTAAAMSYHLNTIGVRHERNVLVYDLGGGTFDVVVLNLKPGGHIVVKSVNGDTHLGGEDFDDNLQEMIIKRYKTKCGIDLKAGKDSNQVVTKANAARILRRLRNACEETKKNISGGSNIHGTVNVAALVGTTDLLEPVSRMEFESLNMDLFLKTLDIVSKALKDAKLEKKDIHDIVLVGGSTRIPKVQQLLSEYFDDKMLRATVNPDEAVACGAAIQAAILNGNQEHILKNITLKDVTPLSLGIELHDGTFSTIIERNSPLPANGTKDYRTAKDHQDSVSVIIFEGEESKAKDNHLLGKFMLRGIPKNKKGIEKILVNMEVDNEGILTVTAICVSTGSKNNISIEDHRGRLTREEKRLLREEFETA